eukprot:g815.t1
MSSKHLSFSPLVDAPSFEQVSCVCLGSGRFLRSVLVPAVRQMGCSVIVAQTRSRTFCEYMASRPGNTYEVDCVSPDGSIATSEEPLAACGTLGDTEGRAAFMALPGKLRHLRLVGVGVTEAGIAHESQSMLDLAEFLFACMGAAPSRAHAHQLAVINTDNVPDNGDKIKECMRLCAFTSGLPTDQRAAFTAWLDEGVCFINSMVDRIVAAREGESQVPRTEPLPAKALVLEDTAEALPRALRNSAGVVVREAPGEIDRDHCLKLRILNATHSAIVYVGALSNLRQTDACVAHPAILPFLEHLFESDISAIAPELGMRRRDVEAIFREWLARLQHPSFGLDCFWVSQNASQKVGIRFLPTILGAHAAGATPSSWMVFAVAAVLRFLTPQGEQPAAEGVFHGRLDGAQPAGEGQQKRKRQRVERDEYVRGLGVDTGAGTYEFRDGDGSIPALLQKLPGEGVSVTTVTFTVLQVLMRIEPAEHARAALRALAPRVGTMLHGMLCGGRTALNTLEELRPEQPVIIPAEKLADVVDVEVAAVEAIDLHTHLFPPEHGELMLWGIDELLTYHYLVAEYFITAPIDPDDFFAKNKTAQADLIWEALFVRRTPLSEACRGVVTTLRLLGLEQALRDRDLGAIRKWYAAQDPSAFVDTVLRVSGLRYVVMTNIPFDPNEARHWTEGKVFNRKQFKSALRIDALFLGDWVVVRAALKESGHEQTLEGARQYLRDWAKTMEPEYLMASTPHDYVYTPSAAGDRVAGADPDAAALLEQVVVPIAQELKLPIAMKLGAHRAVNPALRFGGDGVVRDGGGSVTVLETLVSSFPGVKWLATFLARVNQHEACVLANKFGNLHLYGCWWYCNNPSIIKEMTAMRLELLGSAFTCQHSDSRVLDQLVYKWHHSREVITPVIARKFEDLVKAGWQVSRAEISREVQQLFGGSYEAFMRKDLPSDSFM